MKETRGNIIKCLIECGKVLEAYLTVGNIVRTIKTGAHNDH